MRRPGKEREETKIKIGKNKIEQVQATKNIMRSSYGIPKAQSLPLS